MRLPKLFKRIAVPDRIQWVFDRIKSRKTILVIGEPEGSELAALGAKLKADVVLTERKAHVGGVNYLKKPRKDYDYVLYIGLHLQDALRNYPCATYLKDGGMAFVVAPGGNGSKDLSLSGTILSYSSVHLEHMVGLKAKEIEYYRHGALDPGGGKKSAVEARRLVQFVYMSFDTGKVGEAV